MTLVDRIREHWDMHPCDYDKGQSFDEIDLTVRQMYPYFLDELKVATDNEKIIVEIGIGSGVAACASLSLGSPDRYIMIDLSPETCRIAARHLREHVIDNNYKIFNQDAAKLPLPDASIDRVKSLGVLHHIPHVEAVMAEIKRVLKPGGDVVFMFYNEDSKRFRERWHGSHDEMMCSTDGATNPYTKLYTRASVTELLAKYNIKITRMAEHEDGFALYVNGILPF